MSKNVIQNNAPSKEVVFEVKDKVVQEAVNEIFEQVAKLPATHHITENLLKKITAMLTANSFMQVQLELTPEQTEKLQSVLPKLLDEARDEYIAGVSNDVRTKDICRIVTDNTSKIPERLLSNIAQAINRAAILNCTAVLCDTKNDKFNKVEMQYTKSAGDMTVPTKGIFVASNCVAVIQEATNAIDLTNKEETAKDTPEDKKASKKGKGKSKK